MLVHTVHVITTLIITLAKYINVRTYTKYGTFKLKKSYYKHNTSIVHISATKIRGSHIQLASKPTPLQIVTQNTIGSITKRFHQHLTLHWLSA